MAYLIYSVTINDYKGQLREKELYMLQQESPSEGEFSKTSWEATGTQVNLVIMST